MEFGGGWCDVMAVFITREGTTGPGEGLSHIMVVPADDPRIKILERNIIIIVHTQVEC